MPAASSRTSRPVWSPWSSGSPARPAEDGPTADEAQPRRITGVAQARTGQLDAVAMAFVPVAEQLA